MEAVGDARRRCGTRSTSAPRDSRYTGPRLGRRGRPMARAGGEGGGPGRGHDPSPARLQPAADPPAVGPAARRRGPWDRARARSADAGRRRHPGSTCGGRSHVRVDAGRAEEVCPNLCLELPGRHAGWRDHHDLHVHWSAPGEQGALGAGRARPRVAGHRRSSPRPRRCTSRSSPRSPWGRHRPPPRWQEKRRATGDGRRRSFGSSWRETESRALDRRARRVGQRDHGRARRRDRLHPYECALGDRLDRVPMGRGSALTCSIEARSISSERRHAGTRWSGSTDASAIPGSPLDARRLGPAHRGGDLVPLEAVHAGRAVRAGAGGPGWSSGGRAREIDPRGRDAS